MYTEEIVKQRNELNVSTFTLYKCCRRNKVIKRCGKHHIRYMDESRLSVQELLSMETHDTKFPEYSFCANANERKGLDLCSYRVSRVLGDFYAICDSALGDDALWLYVVWHCVAELLNTSIFQIYHLQLIKKYLGGKTFAAPYHNIMLEFIGHFRVLLFLHRSL